jgi:dCMP deaminase
MNWNQYFFDMIEVVRSKSKDKSTKVGAIIVSPDNSIVSTGFNGFPRGVIDDESKAIPYGRPHHYKTVDVEKRYERPDKYLWTEHAERNAIYAAAKRGVSLDGCKIYVDWYPCSDCCRGIIQVGIKQIIIDARNYEEKEKYWNERWKDQMEVTKRMCYESRVEIYKWEG